MSASQPCSWCGFRASSPPVPVETGRVEDRGCPVCHDGQIDPWALIRELRAAAVEGVSEPATPATAAEEAARFDPLQHEWDLVAPLLASFWPAMRLDSADPQTRDALVRRLCEERGYGQALARELLGNCLDLHDRFQGHWTQVAQRVLERWDCLTPADLQTMEGRKTELTGLIARRTGADWWDVRADVSDFVRKIGYAETGARHQSLEPPVRAAGM